MATYFVSSSGSNTAPYDTWAKAATLLQTALTAASTSGDIVVIQYNAVPTADAENSTAIVYTPSNSIKLIAASNNGGSSYTPTAMSSSYWIGTSTTNANISIAGGYNIYVYGISIRTGSTAVQSSLTLATISPDTQMVFDTCYFWIGNYFSNILRVGPTALNSANAWIRIVNSTIRTYHADHSIRINATTEFEFCSFITGNAVPTAIVKGSDSSDSAGGSCILIGCDMSTLTAAALVGDSIRPVLNFKFIQCKLPTSYTILSSQTVINKSGARVWVFDCASGDTQNIMAYADVLGTLTTDTGIYYTSNSSAASWKITTTSYCSELAVFDTPWIDWYNTGTSAVTPRLEILRDGSTTAFTDAEVWGEFTAKTTSGSTKSTFYTDRNTFGTTISNQDNGAGLASWTGESGTAWSGKLNTTTTITPAEVGVIRARVGVGVASTTIYVDPFIRTA